MLPVDTKRLIYSMKGEASALQVAKRYDCHPNTVYTIWRDGSMVSESVVRSDQIRRKSAKDLCLAAKVIDEALDCAYETMGGCDPFTKSMIVLNALYIQCDDDEKAAIDDAVRDVIVRSKGIEVWDDLMDRINRHPAMAECGEQRSCHRLPTIHRLSSSRPAYHEPCTTVG